MPHGSEGPHLLCCYLGVREATEGHSQWACAAPRGCQSELNNECRKDTRQLAWGPLSTMVGAIMETNSTGHIGHAQHQGRGRVEANAISSSPALLRARMDQSGSSHEACAAPRQVAQWHRRPASTLRQLMRARNDKFVRGGTRVASRFGIAQHHGSRQEGTECPQLRCGT